MQLLCPGPPESAARGPDHSGHGMITPGAGLPFPAPAEGHTNPDHRAAAEAGLAAGQRLELWQEAG